MRTWVLAAIFCFSIPSAYAMVQAGVDVGPVEPVPEEEVQVWVGPGWYHGFWFETEYEYNNWHHNHWHNGQYYGHGRGQQNQPQGRAQQQRQGGGQQPRAGGSRGGGGHR